MNPHPTKIEKGILLAAKWLIETGHTDLAEYLIWDFGLKDLDLSGLEECDKEVLIKLNDEGHCNFKVWKIISPDIFSKFFKFKKTKFCLDFKKGEGG